MKPLWFLAVALGGCVSDVDALKGQWEIDTDRLTFNAPIFGEERRSVDVRNRSGAILRLTVHEPVLVGDCPENPFEPALEHLDVPAHATVGIALFHRPRVWTTETCHAQLLITAEGDWDARSPVLLYGVPRDVDNDGDCVPASVDCDDRPPVGDGVGGVLDPRGRDVHPAYAQASTTADCPDVMLPAAIERCNSVDDDCDGALDADDADSRPPEAKELWLDRDLDGFPGNFAVGWRCEAGLGELEAPSDPTGWDCDDNTTTIFPGGAELVADGVDGDCDGTEACWPDADGDSFGDQPQDRIDRHLDTPTVPLRVAMTADPLCTGQDLTTGAPTGVTARGGDCDDAEPAVHDGAIERCDAVGADEDCDGRANDADLVGPITGQVRGWRDDDGDGHGAGNAEWSCDPAALGFVDSQDDCAPTLPAIHPDAVEVCDRLDNDCDALIDELDLNTPPPDKTPFFPDRDGDGFPDPASPTERCFAAGNELPGTGAFDCDDRDAQTFPGANESIASPLDRDCDDAVRCWADADGDGRGAEAQTSIDLSLGLPDGPITQPRVAGQAACIGVGTAARGGDCNDSAPGAYLGAREQCDPADIDEDCDGFADDDDSEQNLPGATAAWLDIDVDGFGDPATERRTCDGAGAGSVPNDQDCGADNAAVFPGAPERCNGLDDDCDGVVDGSVDGTPPVDAPLWVIDLDGDGQGSATASDPTTGEVVQRCASPGDRYVRNHLDCDDNNAEVRVGAPEVAGDDDDEDCNGLLDCFVDQDSDRVGVIATSSWPDSCDGPGRAARAGDCDDLDAAAAPDRTETCDGVDNDCDGLVDDADPSVDRSAAAAPWFTPDVDGDGWGAGAVVARCTGLPGEVPAFDASGARSPIDCDPADPRVFPGAQELIADGIDQDCDQTDVCHVDLDQDGYGTASTVNAATCAGAGVAFVPGDCDDTSAGAHPGARERCAAGDEDCDGREADDDDDVVDRATWFLDADGDHFGSPAVRVLACAPPARHVADATDCDDAAPEAHPGAVESCGVAGRDEDCDGLADDQDTDLPFDDASRTSWRPDLDRDTFPDALSADVRLCAPIGRMIAVDGMTAAEFDCDDNRAAVHPGVDEVAVNGRDDDCDGSEDCRVDADGDGAGGEALTSVADVDCTPPSPGGYAPAANDCDDADPTFDGTPRVAFFDLDGDLFGDPRQAELICAPLAGRVTDGTDCDDTTQATHPGATELCDAQDNDCDQQIDDNASGQASFFPDVDRDNHGDLLGAPVSACFATSGLAAAADDCDDRRPDVFPGAVGERAADNVDQDCDREELCFADGDLDGVGIETLLLTHDLDCDACDGDPTCSPTSGWSASNADCDDADPTILAAPFPMHLDADGDGHGDQLATTYVCRLDLLPNGGQYLVVGDDCDDGDPRRTPSAVERCDPEDLDEDCDLLADDDDAGGATGKLTFYADGDRDGYGTSATPSCDPRDGIAALAGDCDDLRRGVFPGASGEAPADGIDQDCDSCELCFVDGDADGVGSDATTLVAGGACAGAVLGCGAVVPVTVAPNDNDCDDTDPAATTAESLWFYDLDRDGIGGTDLPPIRSCDDPSTAEVSFRTTPSDCDDHNQAVTNPELWWVDDDGDGVGDDNHSTFACPLADGSPPGGNAWGYGPPDCDDSAPLVYPGAPERCDNVDDDCDATTPADGGLRVDCYVDTDRDGYGHGAPLAQAVCACPAGAATNDADPDDGNALTYPGAPERCDGLDNNGDGQIDEGDPACLVGVTLVVDGPRTWAILDNPAKGSDLATVCSNVAPPNGATPAYRPVRLQNRCDECALEAAANSASVANAWLGYQAPGCGGNWAERWNGQCIAGASYEDDRSPARVGASGLTLASSAVPWVAQGLNSTHDVICEATASVACSTCALAVTDDCAVVDYTCPP